MFATILRRRLAAEAEEAAAMTKNEVEKRLAAAAEGIAKAKINDRIIDNPPPANKKLAQSSKRGGLGTLGYMAPENATSPHL
jgi:hypothetical protein